MTRNNSNSPSMLAADIGHVLPVAMRSVLNRLDDVYLLLDSRGDIVFANDQARSLLQADGLELQGSSLFYWLPDLKQVDVAVGTALSLETTAGLQLFRVKLSETVATEESPLWQIMLSTEEDSVGFRQQLLKQREITQMTLCSIGDAVISVNAQGVIETINPMARELLNLSARGGVGLNVDDVFVVADEEVHRPLPSMVSSVLKYGKSVRTDSSALLYVAGRKPMYITVQAAPLRGGGAEIAGCLLVFRDVSQSQIETSKLEWQASHDALTGLPNRPAFERQVSQSVELAQTSGRTYVLMQLDLHQFKVVNDSCGQAGGDELLRQFAALIDSKLRGQDMVARLGSDDFGVLLVDTTLAGAQRVADIILRAIQDYRFHWGETQIKVGICVGVFMIDREAESDAQAMATVHACCCTAKDLGRNRIHFYSRGSEVERRRSEINWVVKINEALSQQRLRLHRQAVVALQSKGTEQEHHYEVLLRLEDEQGQLIGPGEFIPAAERYGLMDDIDRWVVTHVVRHMAHEQARGISHNSYAVNLSGASIGDPAFVDFVLNAIDCAGVDASRLHFEVTETAAIKHLQPAVEFMSALRQRGSRFYLDDFGSGLSSFAYLKDLPVDFLKIDGMFVHNMLEDDTHFAMVSTINHLAQVMGLQTVAEYVESEPLKNKLSELGVDYAQGFGIGRPEPFPSLP